MIAAVDRIALGCRRRQAAERIRDPDAAVAVAVDLEHGSHENAGAAAPGTGLDEIACDAVLEHVLHRTLQLQHPLGAYHRVRATGPVHADLARVAIERAQPDAGPLERRIVVDQARETVA